MQSCSLRVHILKNMCNNKKSCPRDGSGSILGDNCSQCDSHRQGSSPFLCQSWRAGDLDIDLCRKFLTKSTVHRLADFWWVCTARTKCSFAWVSRYVGQCWEDLEPSKSKTQVAEFIGSEGRLTGVRLRYQVLYLDLSFCWHCDTCSQVVMTSK